MQKLKTVGDLTDFETDILRQEIDLIDKTIARIDQIQIALKGWAITVWGGSLFLVAQHLEESGILILLTAIIPLLFGMLDLIWAKQILIVNYRQEKLARFINAEEEDRNFSFLDPLAKKYSKQQDYLDRINFKKAINHKGIMMFYLSLVTISIILGISLLLTLLK